MERHGSLLTFWRFTNRIIIIIITKVACCLMGAVGLKCRLSSIYIIAVGGWKARSRCTVSENDCQCYSVQFVDVRR